jgi:hypothetical protein
LLVSSISASKTENIGEHFSSTILSLFTAISAGCWQSWQYQCTDLFFSNNRAVCLAQLCTSVADDIPATITGHCSVIDVKRCQLAKFTSFPSLILRFVLRIRFNRTGGLFNQSFSSLTSHHEMQELKNTS